jgi:hypothetical protein
LPCSASFPGRPEGDVMIEIFWDFRQILAKKFGVF